MRVRDIIHRSGRRVRLVLEQAQPGEGPVIRLVDPECPAGQILLDVYGTELLAGFLMSARLAKPGELADEGCHGDYPLRLRLGASGNRAVVALAQSGAELLLHSALWDRLYTELLLVVAHGRHLGRSSPTATLVGVEDHRLLH